ncbi:glycoside hydrolase family 20 protein [Dothistroma septosporum NZE10]|uniref:Glycoside hydrolase family 20 protein n=1 Tax=Dothistroma septosporum (strain NZE10 / CBS 128990) TaxID=675120 RepID=N1PSE4_DOTSN|nr:glycoside hydrolase family 20 protein [Dothistroma septosporum NZE10]
MVLKTILIALSTSPIALADLIGAPTVPFDATKGVYDLNGIHSILIDSQYINAIDQHGQFLKSPTLQAPGHALVITQRKTKLHTKDDASLLNISYPGSVPATHIIWKTFLPWFHSKVAHIIANEYVDASLSNTALVEEYNHLVIDLNSYLRDESNKDVRIWGTFPPMGNSPPPFRATSPSSTWSSSKKTRTSIASSRVKSGSSVVKSHDSFSIVQEHSTSYPAELNRPGSSTQTPMALLSLPTSSTRHMRRITHQRLAPLANKQCGGKLTEEEYNRIYRTLQSAAPAQNLDRNIQSKTSTNLEYEFAALCAGGPSTTIPDLSGNTYTAVTKCSIINSTLNLSQDCSLTTPLSSKGNNYTLCFTLKQTTTNRGSLLSGPDGEFHSGNGTSPRVMLISANNAFALNDSLPVGKWACASLIGRGKRTFFAVDGGQEMKFLTEVGVNGESFAWARVAVVAPLNQSVVRRGKER